MALLDEYCLKFKVDGSKLVVAELKKINKEETKFDKVSDKTTQSINKQSSALWVFARRLLSVYAVYKLFRKGLDISLNFAETGNSLANMATIANVSAKNLQKWGYLLKKYGGDEKTASRVLGTLDSRLYAYKMGQDNGFFDNFMKWGGGTPSGTAEQFLVRLSNLFKKVGFDKAKQLSESLGLDTSMFNLLLKEDIASALKNAPVLYSDEDIRKAQEAKEKLIEFNQALAKLGNTIAREILPFVTRLIEKTTEWLNSDGINLIKKAIGFASGRQSTFVPQEDVSFKNSVLGKFLSDKFSNPFDLLPVLPSLTPISNLGNVLNSSFKQANNININGTTAPEAVANTVMRVITNFTQNPLYNEFGSIYKDTLGFVINRDNR